MRERLYAFDFLRAFMMFLGVFLHGLLFEPTISFLNDTWSDRVMTFLAEVIHTFRMPLFFCLSGFVSSQLLYKLGFGAFWKNRFRRLIIPLILSLLTICFISNLFHHSLVLYAKEKDIVRVLETSFSLRYFQFNEMEPIHLWFLYYLSAFIPAILLVDYVAKRMPIAVIRNFITRIGNQTKSQPLVIVLLAVIPTVLLFLTNNNGNPTPRSFIMSFENFLPYFYYFSFGWFIHRLRFNMRYFTKNAGWFLVLALLLTLARLIAWSILEEHLLIIIILYNLSLWCYIFGFVGIVQVYFNKPSASLQYFSDASYWIYLIHYPVIVGLKLFFNEPASLSTFTMLLLVTAFLSVVSYNYLVRPTVIGKLLNGKILPSYPLHRIQLFTKPVMWMKRISQLQHYRYLSRNYRFSRSKDIQRL